MLGDELSDPILSAQCRTVKTGSHTCGPELERLTLRELVSSLSQEIQGPDSREFVSGSSQELQEIELKLKGTSVRGGDQV